MDEFHTYNILYLCLCIKVNKHTASGDSHGKFFSDHHGNSGDDKYAYDDSTSHSEER